VRPSEIKHKTILFAVLDWGLGHASRSSKLIAQLISQHNTLELVSSGNALYYLKQRFPQLVIHNLGHPEIIYPSHGQLWIQLLLQRNKINGIIKHEQRWLQNRLKQGVKPDLLISDNCYGFHHSEVESILMTHQLHVKAPFFERVIQKKVHQWIKPFNLCWVPDYAGEENLSGELSHPAASNFPVFYIGPLSVFESVKTEEKKFKFHYAAVISGPEKQRSIFEKKVVEFLLQQQKPAVLVRGIKEGSKKLPFHPNLEVHDFKSGPELETIIAQSDVVIARSGYSTIMDMHVLEKKCMLFPTPGQTEQAYLCRKHYGFQPTEFGSIEPKIIKACRG